MSVTYRLARRSELQQIQELIVRSINDLTERHGFGSMASVRPADFQLFSFDDDPQGLWIAEEADEIVGSAFSWVYGKLWFLAELFIAPGKQGSGIGRELLRRTLRHADQAAANTRALITFGFNAVSQGLYIRNGLFPRLSIYMFSADVTACRGSDAGLKVRRVEASVADFEALNAIDLSALGISRKKHHRHLLSDPTMRGFLMSEGSGPIGYAYVASTGHVGPLAVTRPDAMGPAFNTAVAVATRTYLKIAEQSRSAINVG